LRRKLFIKAPASISVPSIEKWSLDSRRLSLSLRRQRGRRLRRGLAFQQSVPVGG
jgi:hypothetical protein